MGKRPKQTPALPGRTGSFLVAVLKYHVQKQRNLFVFWLQRAGICNGGEGIVAGAGRKLADDVFIHSQEQERGNRKWVRL